MKLAAWVLALLAMLSCRPQGPPQIAPETLAGVWGSEQVFGPAVRGALAIDGQGPQWRATIAGFNVPVEREQDAIRFTLSGAAGEFRGRLAADAKSIQGHWIQPAGVANSNRYATPVRLAEQSSRAWRGIVTPLDDRISFYVSIERGPGGSVSAFIRNPEFNFFRRRTFRVEVRDGAVVFTDPKNASDRLRGTYDRQADRLMLPVLDAHPPLPFTRRKDGNAVGFFPRIPPGAPYVYRKPVDNGDGWPAASLAEAGLDPKPIHALIQKILDSGQRDNPVNIQSLLIVRHGKLALEEYFYGFDRERPHDTRSAGKTYAPVLAGIARDHGANIGPSTPVYALFPRLQPFANGDERKNRMTLENIMTMTSGLACDDNSDSSPGKEDTMQGQEKQPDWYKYTLDLPMAHDPGGAHAIYCSAGINLIGGVVRNATGKWIPELFDDAIARPLRFHTYHMNLMPTGEAYLGGGMAIRPRDEVKLGQLYLSGGMWNGRRVVSQAWVNQSIASHAKFDPQIDFDLDHEYGYGWHIYHLKAGGGAYRAFAAGGNGGQLVMVIPDLDLVVGFNGGAYGEFAKWYRWGLQLVPEYIIPAALPGDHP